MAVTPRRTEPPDRPSLCHCRAATLPFSDGRPDVAAMALVGIFVPKPALGVIEMARGASLEDGPNLCLHPMLS